MVPLWRVRRYSMKLTASQSSERVWVSEWLVMPCQEAPNPPCSGHCCFNSTKEFSSTKNKQTKVGVTIQYSSKQIKTAKLWGVVRYQSLMELVHMLECIIFARTWPNNYNMQHPQYCMKNLTSFKFEPTTPNMSQQATWCALQCCDVLRWNVTLWSFGRVRATMLRHGMRTTSIFNSQHVATPRNMVAKRMQHVAPNNVEICCVEMLRSFGRGLQILGQQCCDRLARAYENAESKKAVKFCLNRCF